MSAVKKSTASKKKPVASSHPPFADMIKECIAAHSSEARTGVSRPTIKKFLEERYGIPISATTVNNINRAIAHGAEKGVFALPKGPSGKVKLAPKARSDAGKENAAPTPATKTIKKPEKKTTTSRPVKKTPTTAVARSKKTAVTAGKRTTTAKKSTAAPASKKTSKPPVKSATKTTSKPAAKTAKPVAKSTTKKTTTKPATKAVPKKVSSKRGPTTAKKALVGSSSNRGKSAKSVATKAAGKKTATVSKRKAPTKRS